MREYFDILQTVALFSKIEKNEIASMLSCLGARVVTAKKGEFALLAGSPVEHIGIVLDGEVHVIRETLDGERSVIAALSPGDYFGEALCCAGVTESPVSVVAVSGAKIMLLAFGRILRACPSSCPFHARLIENMLYVMAKKNLYLQSRMDILSGKTLREKVLTYLRSLRATTGKPITVPLDREAMADYLCVDRSALSHELSRMKKAGLIDYRKNVFTLL